MAEAVHGNGNGFWKLAAIGLAGALVGGSGVAGVHQAVDPAAQPAATSTPATSTSYLEDRKYLHETLKRIERDLAEVKREVFELREERNDD